MKTFFKFMILAVVACGFWSCSDDDEAPAGMPNVSYYEIAGTWKMTQWNGEEMNDGRYFYVTFDRREREFVIYQNIDTEKTRQLTGRFILDFDEELGTVIQGDYHHASGQWNQSYLLNEFSADQMTWVVVTREFGLPANPWIPDFTDVTIYTRVDAVPEEVLNNMRSL